MTTIRDWLCYRIVMAMPGWFTRTRIGWAAQMALLRAGQQAAEATLRADRARMDLAELERLAQDEVQIVNSGDHQTFIQLPVTIRAQVE